MKVCDSLYCIKDYDLYGDRYFYYGCKYKIIEIDYNLNEIYILFGDGSMRFFIAGENFKKTFMSIKELRKNKLKKIERFSL